MSLYPISDLYMHSFGFFELFMHFERKYEAS